MLRGQLNCPLRIYEQRVHRRAPRHEQTIAGSPSETDIRNALRNVDPPDRFSLRVENRDAVEPFGAHAPADPEVAIHVARAFRQACRWVRR